MISGRSPVSSEVSMCPPQRPAGISPTLLDPATRVKGWEVQDIKPSAALDLLAVVVERITPADPAVAQGPLVRRRRSIAVLQASTPIANHRQRPLGESARAPWRQPN